MPLLAHLLAPNRQPGLIPSVGRCCTVMGRHLYLCILFLVFCCFVEGWWRWSRSEDPGFAVFMSVWHGA